MASLQIGVWFSFRLGWKCLKKELWVALCKLWGLGSTLWPQVLASSWWWHPGGVALPAGLHWPFSLVTMAGLFFPVNTGSWISRWFSAYFLSKWRLSEGDLSALRSVRLWYGSVFIRPEHGTWQRRVAAELEGIKFKSNLKNFPCIA